MGSSLSSLQNLVHPLHVPKVYVANSNPLFPAKSTNVLEQTGKISLWNFLTAHCPSLFSGFRLSWWLFNGHLQTIYSVLGDFSKVDKVVYDRTLLRLKDGGTLGLDFTPPYESRRIFSDETPVLVVTHGLTGGSHESYVRAIIAPAITPKEEGGLGYRAVVINFRGCAGVPLTSAQLYSSCHTDDLRQALVYISHLYPKAPLLGVGFSLGANVMTKFVAEEGERCRLKSTCVLGCPWNLVKNSEHLQYTWWRRNLYSKGMGSNLKRLLNRHSETIAQFPGSPLAQAASKLSSMKSVTLVDFDNVVTCNSGGASPPFPFANAWDYYAYGASHKDLKDVRIPFLGINSQDDPIVLEVPTDAGGNEWVAIVVTARGGHLGWFEVAKGSSGGTSRWIRKPVIEWLKATAEEIDLHRADRELMAVREVDGWFIEADRQHLGCRVIGERGVVVGAEGQGNLLAGL